MVTTRFITEGAHSFLPQDLFIAEKESINNAYNQLVTKQGAGNDFLGWLSLPEEISTDEISKINRVTSRLQAQSEVVVVIGIGGSYWVPEP